MTSPEFQPPRRTFKDYIWIAARGYCMGAADVVPGVSGGTMAFILGIYDELLQAIHAVDVSLIRRVLTFRWREVFDTFPWRFLLALGLGIATAILTLAQGLQWALTHHAPLVWAFFFGLVLASVITVRKRVKVWNVSTVFAAVLATVGAYVLVGLTPTQTPDEPWFLFLSGAIAICAMILPGISGAFILVLLGKYQYVLDAVVQRDVATLFFVALGCALGLISFVRFLRWLFRYYHDATVAVLTGFMLGSLRKVWPWKETLATITDRHGDLIPVKEANVLPAAIGPEVVAAVALALLGIGLVYGLERLAEQREGTAGAIAPSNSG